MLTSLLDQLDRRFNRAPEMGPHPPAPVFPPPQGAKQNWVHWGVMIPDLPAPHHFFNVMSIAGTTGVSLFDPPVPVPTTPRDTATAISGTAATPDAFSTFSISQDCEFAPDGSSIRFGDELSITGPYPNLHLERRVNDAEIVLDMEVLGPVSYFFEFPAGLYTHWSILSRCRGTTSNDSGVTPVDTLGTWEYAIGTGIHALPAPRLLRGRTVPLDYFTYHVLNVSEDTQILFAQWVGGPGKAVSQAFIRRLDGTETNYRTDDVRLDVLEYAEEPLICPGGRAMRTPSRFEWTVGNETQGRIMRVEGTAAGDWIGGLGGGGAGSYAYTGTFGGEEISGNAYIELVDCR